MGSMEATIKDRRLITEDVVVDRSLGSAHTGIHTLNGVRTEDDVEQEGITGLGVGISLTEETDELIGILAVGLCESRLCLIPSHSLQFGIMVEACKLIDRCTHHDGDIGRELLARLVDGVGRKHITIDDWSLTKDEGMQTLPPPPD